MWDTIERLWSDAVARAERLPESARHERVDGEWSFVETLRHLVFIADSWASRTVLDEAMPYHRLGLPQTAYHRGRRRARHRPRRAPVVRRGDGGPRRTDGARCVASSTASPTATSAGRVFPLPPRPATPRRPARSPSASLLSWKRSVSTCASPCVTSSCSKLADDPRADAQRDNHSRRPRRSLSSGPASSSTLGTVIRSAASRRWAASAKDSADSAGSRSKLSLVTMATPFACADRDTSVALLIPRMSAIGAGFHSVVVHSRVVKQSLVRGLSRVESNSMAQPDQSLR